MTKFKHGLLLVAIFAWQVSLKAPTPGELAKQKRDAAEWGHAAGLLATEMEATRVMRDTGSEGVAGLNEIMALAPASAEAARKKEQERIQAEERDKRLGRAGITDTWMAVENIAAGRPVDYGMPPVATAQASQAPGAAGTQSPRVAVSAAAAPETPASPRVAAGSQSPRGAAWAPPVAPPEVGVGTGESLTPRRAQASAPTEPARPVEVFGDDEPAPATILTPRSSQTAQGQAPGVGTGASTPRTAGVRLPPLRTDVAAAKARETEARVEGGVPTPRMDELARLARQGFLPNTGSDAPAIAVSGEPKVKIGNGQSDFGQGGPGASRVATLPAVAQAAARLAESTPAPAAAAVPARELADETRPPATRSQPKAEPVAPGAAPATSIRAVTIVEAARLAGRRAAAAAKEAKAAEAATSGRTLSKKEKKAKVAAVAVDAFLRIGKGGAGIPPRPVAHTELVATTIEARTVPSLSSSAPAAVGARVTRPAARGSGIGGRGTGTGGGH